MITNTQGVVLIADYIKVIVAKHWTNISIKKMVKSVKMSVIHAFNYEPVVSLYSQSRFEDSITQLTSHYIYS